MDPHASPSAMFAADADAVVLQMNTREPFDLNVACVDEDAPNDESLMLSKGLSEDEGEDTAQPDAFREVSLTLTIETNGQPTKNAPAEEAGEATPVEEANFARPTPMTTTPTQQREWPNKRSRRALPGEGPSNVMPGLNSPNLQPVVPSHPVTYVQTLQREIRRISMDRDKTRDEMMRARSAVGDLQSQLVQLGKEREALRTENEALQRESEELRGNRSSDPSSTHHC
ncbi:VARLMGL domain-containing protein [Psidium guajava]|nr:VARLMGL domain-containing protein [Psidium guajava]